MTNQLGPSVVLASGSPRRRSFLADLGVEFEVIAADIDETPRSGENPSAYVERLSCEKAFHVGRLISSPNVGVDSSRLSLVIAADTTVTFEGEILGKPEDHETNGAMLRLLSERTHHVMSGVAVVVANAIEHTVATCVVTTEVRFRKLTEVDISWYLATGEGLDKAGGYAIQGRAAAFVERVNGSVSNVVGLPLSELLDLLRRVGHPIETLRPRHQVYPYSVARRPFTTAPFVLPMSTGTFLKLRRTTIVLVLFALIVSMSWSSLVWGGKKRLCGIHAPQERQLELQLQAATSDLGQYEEALREVETSPESTAQTKASARRIRMECGFVRDHGEVVEAVAVQMVAASVKLDAGSAPPVFYAAQAASNKAVGLETLKTGGRFDSRLVLQRLLDQPVSSTPNEFDPSRKIVKSFVDDLSRYRKSWK